MTDFNGWQTAYGYDDGASRARFTRSVRRFRADFAAARKELTDPREARLLREIGVRFDRFMELDDVAYAALQRGETRREEDLPRAGAAPVRRDGPALRGARHATRRAGPRPRNRRSTIRARTSRRALIAVGLGAALVIVLLLVTAADIARLAIEGRHRVRQ